jgi:hypothetical protein
MNFGVGQVERVRQQIRATLADMGCQTAELQEAILVRGGMYCGRRFVCPGGSAVWFIEEEQVKYYNAAGALKMTAVMPAAAAPAANAASDAPRTIPLRRAA